MTVKARHKKYCLDQHKIYLEENENLGVFFQIRLNWENRL